MVVEETEKATQPAGRAAEVERMVRLEMPFPERDLMEGVWAVMVAWEVERVV